jgi:ubiquinone/menaquinone biosynthesis C-methylase UbiE
MSTNSHAEVCPWWLCFTFDNFIRRRLQNPFKILSPYIKEGYQVLDVGPGMGYFTIPAAKLVGATGRVVAADLQKHMLAAILRRAVKAGVQDRIILHQTEPDRIGVSCLFDFCLVFWMVHEVSDRKRFLSDIAAVLKPGGTMLLAEPKLHVSKVNFNLTLNICLEIGLQVSEQPKIFISNAVLLKNVR